MRLVIKYSLVLILAFLHSCIEPFDPKVVDVNQSLLVVDGVITDQPGPYVIKITNSTSLTGDPVAISVSNIFIEDSDGNVESLTEMSTGVYQTSTLRGETGQSYRLNFELNGELCQSTWEQIKESSMIDGIDYQVERKETSDSDIDLVGVQFFIDNSGTTLAQNYFRFEQYETWETSVVHRPEFNYLGSDQIEAIAESLPSTCWKYKKSKDVNLATTEGLIMNELSSHKLGFMLGNDGEERFTVLYSLLVKQYTIDENEYLFWKNVKESNDEIGGLFDKQPAQVFGNITNVSNPRNDILGYFSASGLQENRIFVEPHQVRDPSFALTCQPLRSVYKSEFEMASEYEAALTLLLSGKSYYFENFIYLNEGKENESILGVILARDACVDCTRKGGNTTKPEFWNE